MGRARASIGKTVMAPFNDPGGTQRVVRGGGTRYPRRVVPGRVRLEGGEVFAGHYRVERPLSMGGMGAVYVVTDLDTERRRALKVMLPELAQSPEARERFRREAQVGAAIQSDHVVEVLAAGVDEASGTPYLVMELLEGDDLADVVSRRGALPPAEVAALFEQLGHALAAAHRAGVVHRDLKPENLFLARSRRSDAELTLKILDFGIAKIVAEAHSGKATQSIGSPMWMAPEQTVAGSRISPATDIWALGLIAFCLLTGRPYWRAANTKEREAMMILREVAFEPIERASERAAELGVGDRLPAGFDDWFAQTVTRDPDARFASVDALCAALLPLLDPGRVPRPRAGEGDAFHLTGSERADSSMATHEFAPHLLTDPSAATLLHPATHDPSPHPPSGADVARGQTPPRAEASTTNVPVTALDTTPRPTPRKAPIAIAVVAVAALAGVFALRAELRPPSASTAPAEVSTEVNAAPSAASLASPELGLDALAVFVSPRGARSDELMSASFWMGAARDFERAAAQPGAPPRWGAAERFCSGKVALIEGKLEAAAGAFREAIALDEAWAAPYTGLALALSRLDRTDEALDAALAAQQRDRDWYVPLSVAANVYARAGKLEEALQEHRRALAKHPDDAGLLANVALGCHAVRLDSEADRFAQAALDKDPNLVAPRLLLAERALEDNDAKTALEQATRAASIAPRNAAAHLARGDALSLLGSWDEAKLAYERALALADAAGGAEARSGRIQAVREKLARGLRPAPRKPAEPGRTAASPTPQKPPPRTACSPADPLCSGF